MKKSSERNEYDVIVIGGGPRGATASYQSQNLGFNTLLIYKETFPRHKLCGGLLTNKNIRLLGKVFDETEKSLKEKDIINFSSDKYEAYFKDDLLVEDNIDIPFYFTEREVYDNFLFQNAKKLGVETIEVEGVKEIDVDSIKIVTEDDREFSAEYIIAADGSTSIARKQLIKENKINKTRNEWSENLAMGVEAYVPRSKVDINVNHPVIHFGVLNWGYGWIFPNKDKFLIGVGGD